MMKYRRYLELKSNDRLTFIFLHLIFLKNIKRRRKAEKEKIQEYLIDNDITKFESYYFWFSPNWVYEVEFENFKFRIYEVEFEKYFKIDLKKTRKLKLENLKSVQN